MEKLPECWMITVQSILTRQGGFWWLVKPETNKKNTPCRFEQKQEEYILIYFFPGPRCWRRAQSRAERERTRGCSDLFVDTLRTVEAFEDKVSAIDRVPTQVCKVWSGMFMSSGLWKDDRFAGNVRWNTFSFRSVKLLFLQEPWIFTNTELFLSAVEKKKRTSSRKWPPRRSL